MKILIVCGAGISTSIMAAMMEDYVSDQDKIIATAYDRMNRYIDDIDVLLVAPQLKNLYYFIEDKCNEKSVGCLLLSDDIYGHLDGQKAVEIAKSLYKEKREKIKRVKIILVCGSGITTGIIIQSVKKTINELEVPIDCEAYGISPINSIRFKGADVIALAPQVRYLKEEVELNYPHIPVKLIDMDVFAKLNGRKILMDLIEEFDLLNKYKKD